MAYRNLSLDINFTLDLIVMFVIKPIIANIAENISCTSKFVCSLKIFANWYDIFSQNDHKGIIQNDRL